MSKRIAISWSGGDLPADTIILKMRMGNMAPQKTEEAVGTGAQSGVHLS
jgi:hypothetical protein